MTAIVEVQALNFRYRGADQPAVRDLHFRIMPGEIFGFLGPSGAGKSTVQKILIGLLAGFSGSVSVRSRPISEWGSEFYEAIGVGFEFPNLFSKLTARENLRYFAGLYREPGGNPDALLEEVGLLADADKRVGEFSKGMKTRLGVARAFLNDPELLFLDEPTTGLDPVNARAIKQLIRDRTRGEKTVFLTTHDMAVADELCDRVAFIVDGQINVIDAPRALKLEHGERSLRVEHRVDGALETTVFPLEGIGDNRAFAALLRSAELETVHSQEASLDDVFVKVTGRALK